MSVFLWLSGRVTMESLSSMVVICFVYYDSQYKQGPTVGLMRK